MGWFSKAVPERKWTDVSVALGFQLKAARDSWFSTFQHGTASHGFVLAPSGISDAARHYVGLLELSAVAATLKENGYVSDVTFFIELLYIILTGNPPAAFHRDIEALPFARIGDAQASLRLWAGSMASELSSANDNPALLEELSRYGTFLVVQAKIATCEACGDHKGAAKIRSFFGGEA
jgi:hypothetical protein